jgi:hypothetical protein
MIRGRRVNFNSEYEGRSQTARGIGAEILFYRKAVKKIEADSPVFGVKRAGRNFAQQNCCSLLSPAKNAPKFRIEES